MGDDWETQTHWDKDGGVDWEAQTHWVKDGGDWERPQGRNLGFGTQRGRSPSGLVEGPWGAPPVRGEESTKRRVEGREGSWKGEGWTGRTEGERGQTDRQEGWVVGWEGRRDG